MKYCYECGAEIGEKDKRCPSCSIKLKRVDEKMKRGTKIIIILLSVMIIPVILSSAVVVTYIFMADDPADIQTGIKQSLDIQNMMARSTAPPATAAPPSETPGASERRDGEQKSGISSSGYKVYYDREYNFSCAYPEEFEVYNDNTANGRYTLRSADGSGLVKICASKNSTNITSEQSLSVFKSKYGGIVETEKSGESYYEIKIRNGGRHYYKYLRLQKGNMYWFELEYEDKDRAVYDEYIDYLYNSFTIK